MKRDNVNYLLVGGFVLLMAASLQLQFRFMSCGSTLVLQQ